MLKTVVTLFRGSQAAAVEDLKDRNALLILDQQMRDASTTLDQARRALAVALAEDGQERRRTEAVASRIVTLEERARAALAGQREDLALEAAEAIASLETDRDAGQQARCMLGSEIARLRRCVSQGEQRFAQLQRGRRLARVAEAVRVSRHGRVEPAVSMRGTLGEAEATLARLRERQDLVIDAEEILGDLEPGDPQPSAEDRLADAGFGPPTRPTAASVLARLKQA